MEIDLPPWLFIYLCICYVIGGLTAPTDSHLLRKMAFFRSEGHSKINIGIYNLRRISNRMSVIKLHIDPLRATLGNQSRKTRPNKYTQRGDRDTTDRRFCRNLASFQRVACFEKYLKSTKKFPIKYV